DDRRPAEQAALGRMRRPLLGLAALALERLEQDGLLPKRVGARDGPDRDDDAPPRTEDRRADEAGIFCGPDRALEPADRLGRIRPDGDESLARAHREGRELSALHAP